KRRNIDGVSGCRDRRAEDVSGRDDAMRVSRIIKFWSATPDEPIGTSGSAAIEFAMVLPVVMALTAGAINYGLMGLQMSTLISAARGGAEYAKGNPADASLTTNTATVTGVTS